MTGDLPPAETTRTPGEHFFNVDRMTNRELSMTWRSFTASASKVYYQGFGDSYYGSDLQVYESLWENLVAATGELAGRGPERLKRIVEWSAQSKSNIDREFAARIAPHLIHQDYEFTRDVLVRLNVGLDDDVVQDGGGHFVEVAAERTQILMRDVLTEAQIADFNMHLVVYGEEHELGPALPHMR